jgi:hypothetical protein
MGGDEGEGDIPFPKILKHFTTLIQESGETPLCIDGINLDWKNMDEWVKAIGPPIVINLKTTDEKELIKRGRKKREEDVNG